MIPYVDMERPEEWRGKFKRGQLWRSTEAATCGVCGCESNLWEMAGYPGMGPRLICPGERRYSDLHDGIKRKRLTISDNGHYGNPCLPRAVIDALKKELKQDKT